MLIVASPKSASTSLRNTLCGEHALDPVHEGLWNLPISSEFYCYSRLWPAHMRELNQATVSRITSHQSIARFHVLPTENNLDLLRNHKKVVLLRPAKQVLLALRRAVKLGIQDRLPVDFLYCDQSDEAWLQRAQSIGLLDDMIQFIERWRKHDGDKLHIEYEDLIADPAHEIEKIEQYFDLMPSGAKRLRKDNFSKSWYQVLKHRFLN